MTVKVVLFVQALLLSVLNSQNILVDELVNHNILSYSLFLLGFAIALPNLRFINVNVRHEIKIFDVIGIKRNIINNRCRTYNGIRNL